MLGQLGQIFFGTLRPNVAPPPVGGDGSVVRERLTQIATPGLDCKEAEAATQETELWSTSLVTMHQI